MKLILAAFAFLALNAQAETFELHTFEAGVAPFAKYDSPIGECDSLHDEDELWECNNWITCIARDEHRNAFKYTGSYGKPTKVNSAKALAKCRAGSPSPNSCRVTVCRKGRW